MRATIRIKNMKMNDRNMEIHI